MAVDETLLVVNAGSSSVRLSLYREGPEGAPEPVAGVRHEGTEADPAWVRDLLAEAMPRMVAHRVVHGGALRTPRLINPEVRTELDRVTALAPLHNPAALRWVDACQELFGPDLPQLAVFDTAFFADLPPHAAVYGLPTDFAERHGVRRYGFHGIAHEALWRAWCRRRPELPRGGRIITLQLGAGCSATATDRGRAVETSMGFTPAEGLLMATRSGDIDPGLLVHLLRSGVGLDALEDLMLRKGGLRGLSGRSSDMRTLLSLDDEASRLAIRVYVHRIRKYVGAYAAVLGGLDGIVFGGGVGEHAPLVRAQALQGLEAFGIVLDPDANEAACGTAARISSPTSRVEIRVQPVDEARVIAEAALQALRSLD